MKTKRIKIFVMALAILPILAIAMLNTSTVSGVARTDDEEIAKLYKTKCGACHGAAAAKFYDPEVAIEEQVEIIMKGKKGEKPPYMPGFEAKGMTTEEATAFANYMKKLRTPPEN